MKKYSKFKKRLAAFLVVNGALGWLLVFIATFMLGNYIHNTSPSTDTLTILQLILSSYGITSFLVAMTFVVVPIMYDAMKGDSYWKRHPEYISQEISRASYVNYYLDRTDKGTAVDVLIVANNIFWLALIFDSFMSAYFNAFIIFVVLALISAIPTTIFVIKPISKYIATRRTIGRKERVYGAPNSDPDDKYRMK